jgi:hypothetical protein
LPGKPKQAKVTPRRTWSVTEAARAMPEPVRRNRSVV